MSDDQARPHYYAVPDPLNPELMSFWYEPRRGRDQGKLLPWPPRRNRWGRLYHSAIPADADRAAFTRQYFDRLRDAQAIVVEAIRGNPKLAAARFARYAIACSSCGKALIEERSKMYGVGPECRKGMSAGWLSRQIELVKQVYAEAELQDPTVTPAGEVER